MLAILPFISFVVCALFAVYIFKRWQAHRTPQSLLWGIGVVFYGIGSFTEAFYAAFGWNALIFRLWYLFGAILVAAWLGQGTVYLLAKRQVAHILMIVLLLGSIFAVVKVFTDELSQDAMVAKAHSSVELNGNAIVTQGFSARSLTPFFNIYGTITLAGGAAYSAWLFWRKRVLLHRTVGNILIAAGALAPAMGGAFSRLGQPGLLYLLELIGVVLMFFGYLRATMPIAESAEASPAAAQP